MDGILAIEHNREALKRILASLVAMAGLAGVDLSVRARGGARRTLPRHLYLAVLRLLRPAEAAARRLIVALALTAAWRAREGKAAVPLPPHVFAQTEA